MKKSKQRSAVWSIINWSVIRAAVDEKLAISPDKYSIEKAINAIEAEYTESELFLKEASKLEALIVNELILILRKDRRKEIKRKLARRSEVKKQNDLRNRSKFDRGNAKIQIFGLDELSDMDPEMMEELSKGILDQLMGKKRKDKDKDDDEDEPNSTFYL